MSPKISEPRILEEKDEQSEVASRLDAIMEPADDAKLAAVKTEVEAQIEELNMQAVRRRKVRELRDMGYSVSEILKILSKGIIIDKTKHEFKGLNQITIKKDLDYILSEDLASDRDFPEKRAEMLSKYNYLYKRAVALALNDNTMTKAAFLNVAKAVLDKITELEGINSTEIRSPKYNELSKPSKVAEEMVSVTSKEERDAINDAINQIFTNGDEETDSGVPIFDEPPGIPARPSDDKGVSGQPVVHKRGRPPKAKQQENTD